MHWPPVPGWDGLETEGAIPGRGPHPRDTVGTVDLGQGTGTKGPGTETGTGTETRREARVCAVNLGAAHLANGVLLLGTVPHQGRGRYHGRGRDLKKNGRHLEERRGQNPLKR